MTLRQTAAARVINEDFQVTGLIGDLHAANEAFSVCAEVRVQAQIKYDSAKAEFEAAKAAITEGLVASAYAKNEKVIQAELDRRIKSAHYDSGDLSIAEGDLTFAKAKLDTASAEYEQARINHRTLVTNLNAAAAALNFLSASKTARAIALQNLADS